LATVITFLIAPFLSECYQIYFSTNFPYEGKQDENKNDKMDDLSKGVHKELPKSPIDSNFIE